MLTHLEVSGTRPDHGIPRAIALWQDIKVKGPHYPLAWVSTLNRKGQVVLTRCPRFADRTLAQLHKRFLGDFPAHPDTVYPNYFSLRDALGYELLERAEIELARTDIAANRARLNEAITVRLDTLSLSRGD